jgi:hypothetical protein
MPHLPPTHHETSKHDSPNETKIKEKQNETILDSNSNLAKSMTHHNQTKELTTWFLSIQSLKLKFISVTTVVQSMQLGRWANEASKVLSHPPNSAKSHSALHSFIEVSMVSISKHHPNIGMNCKFCPLFCVEDPQKCSTVGVSLQLHWRRQCAPAHPSVGSSSRRFIER